MAKNPDQRISTATDVATLLEQCLAHAQQPTAVPLPVIATINNAPIGNRPSLSTRNFRSRSDWAFLVLAVVVVLAVWMLRPRTKPEDREIPSSASVATGEDGETADEAIPAIDALDPTFNWNQSQAELNAVDQTLNQIETNVASEVSAEE